MMSYIVDNVHVTADPSLTISEIQQIIAEEMLDWQQKGKLISSVEMTVEGDQIIVRSVEKSPIKRVRRITGYLSNIENFNDAKRDELATRAKHM